MIKPIMKDVLFLAQKSEEATKDDLYIVDDLIDTSIITDKKILMKRKNVVCH